MLKVGITGNIASGKSEVEKIIKDMGYLVFNFDDISHELFLDEKIQEILKKKFNTFKREEISDIVFKDANKRRELEKIFHPLLYKRAQALFELHEDEKIIFFSGALIYEAEFDKMFDKIIFVDADFMIRLQRLKKRNHFNDKEAMIRLNCQTLKYKNKADFNILNNDDIDKLKNETQILINSLI